VRRQEVYNVRQQYDDARHDKPAIGLSSDPVSFRLPNIVTQRLHGPMSVGRLEDGAAFGSTDPLVTCDDERIEEEDAYSTAGR
jgi:hypothetical protein